MLGGITASHILVEKESIPKSSDSVSHYQTIIQQHEEKLLKLNETLYRDSVKISDLTQERNLLMEKQKNYEDTLVKRQRQIDSLQNLLQVAHDSLTIVKSVK